MTGNLGRCLSCIVIETHNFKISQFQNAVIKTSSCYCVMIPRTENDVSSKETIIL